MSSKQLEQIRNETLGASLRRVLGRPTGLKLVTADERPTPAQERRERTLADLRAIFGDSPRVQSAT